MKERRAVNSSCVLSATAKGVPPSNGKLVFIVGMLCLAIVSSCVAGCRGRVMCTPSAATVTGSVPKREPEWGWFGFPSEVEATLRSRGLVLVGAEPLWRRSGGDSEQGHLRMYWHGPLIGTAISEVAWNEQHASAECVTDDRVAKFSGPRDKMAPFDAAIRACVDGFVSGCFGATVEMPEPAPVMDGSRLTLEYRSGSVVYAVARATPTRDAQDRRTLELVSCACELLRASMTAVPNAFGTICHESM